MWFDMNGLNMAVKEQQMQMLEERVAQQDDELAHMERCVWFLELIGFRAGSVLQKGPAASRAATSTPATGGSVKRHSLYQRSMVYV